MLEVLVIKNVHILHVCLYVFKQLAYFCFKVIFKLYLYLSSILFTCDSLVQEFHDFLAFCVVLDLICFSHVDLILISRFVLLNI